jgi:tetratricopeptide (TPR) repeat protein
MEKAEAQYHFHEADRLYKEEHYLEALQHLSELNRAYADTFNILFPMLLCRQKLGRIREAYDQCAGMLEQFPEGKHQQRLRTLFGEICREKARTAHEIKSALPVTKQGVVLDAPNVIVLDKRDLLTVGGMEIPWKVILLYTAVIGVFVLLLAMVPAVISQVEAESPVSLKIFVVVLILFIQFATSCLVAYTALWTLSKLPHEDMLRDIMDIAIFMVIFYFLCCIPLIGWIFALYYLSQHYELSFGEVIIYLLLQVVFQMLFLFGILPLVLGENALQLIELLW